MASLVMRKAFFKAATSGDCDAVARCLENEVPIDSEDADKWSALMLAAKEDHVEICKLLLQKNANLTHCDEHGWTAIFAAAAAGHFCAVDLLLTGGLSIGQPIDLEHKSHDGRTALFCAAANGHEGVVDLMLQRGAQLEHSDQNRAFTALQCAAITGQHKMCKLLLDARAEINMTNLKGFTALTYASAYGQTHTAEVLLKRGADCEIPTKQGLTPLIWAAKMKQYEAVKVLASHGAKPVTKEGKVAISYARDKIAFVKWFKEGQEVAAQINEQFIRELAEPVRTPVLSAKSGSISLDRVSPVCSPVCSHQLPPEENTPTSGMKTKLNKQNSFLVPILLLVVALLIGVIISPKIS